MKNMTKVIIYILIIMPGRCVVDRERLNSVRTDR